MINKLGLTALLSILGFLIWTLYPVLVEPEIIYYTDNMDTAQSSYKRIKKSGVLRVATRLNGVGCFYKRGELRGLECEVLKNYADEIGVQLQIVSKPDLNELFYALVNRQVDIVAADLTPTEERSQLVSFSHPIMQTREALIHRKDNRVSKIEDLAYKTVSVRKGTVYEDELETLNHKSKVFIQLLPIGISTLEVIKGVAEGEWSYTIADEHIANSLNAQHSALAQPIIFGEPRNISFALSKHSQTLTESLNNWIQSKKAQAIISSYQSQQSETAKLNNQKISEWDHYFQKYSEPPFNWLWLAAQAHTESAFRADARSSCGAKGIMQLMPETAVDMQVLNIYDPAENIEGGAKYNRWIYQNYWKDLPYKDALAFTFASYNAGIGHVLDAQRLTLHSGGDPYKWFGNVENYIVKLEKEQFNTLAYVKYGYCRGNETRDYVTRIFKRYEMYNNQVKRKMNF